MKILSVASSFTYNLEVVAKDQYKAIAEKIATNTEAQAKLEVIIEC